MTKFRLVLNTIIFLSAGTPLLATAWQAQLPVSMPAPADNPTTAEKTHLGQALFFDTRLSSGGTVSCASCHIPDIGGDDDLPVAIGVGGASGTRNAPTVLNAGLQSAQFWDGRAPSLEAQALGPMINGVEMGNASHDDVVNTAKSIAGYAPLFAAAFGSGDTINIDNITRAIAAFERTLLTPNSPFDRYLAGDTAAMTADQISGMALFENKGCTQCHTGPLLATQSIVPGTAFLKRFPKIETSGYVIQYDLLADLGLFESTGQESDKKFWKVPTLRNIELTAPYFHNGSVATLEEAVRVMAKTQNDDDLSDSEAMLLAAFLRALTGELPDVGPITVSATPTTQVPIPAFAIAILVAISCALAMREAAYAVTTASKKHDTTKPSHQRAEV